MVTFASIVYSMRCKSSTTGRAPPNIEFDAGMPRRAAEAMALQEVLAMQTRIYASQGELDGGYGLR